MAGADANIERLVLAYLEKRGFVPYLEHSARPLLIFSDKRLDP